MGGLLERRVDKGSWLARKREFYYSSAMRKSSKSYFHSENSSGEMVSSLFLFFRMPRLLFFP